MSEFKLFSDHVLKLSLGTIPHNDVHLYSGHELLQSVADELYLAAPIATLMNIVLTEVEEGRVVFSDLPSERHFN